MKTPFINKETKVLAEYPSASNPGKKYEVRCGRDGVIYCTCWQWIKNKDCKHLQMYLADMKQQGVKVTKKDLDWVVEREIQSLLS
jgi:hypothetical protein